MLSAFGSDAPGILGVFYISEVMVATAITEPFAVDWVAARPGEQQVEPKWCAPFDEEWRPVHVPNVPAGSLQAYTSIGAHVVKNAAKYCPAYHVVKSLNARMLNDRAAKEEWDKAVAAKDGSAVVVSDRRNGQMVILCVAVSQLEAVVSWFSRTPQSEGGVLCRDRAKDEFYIEPVRSELVVAIGADGTEIAADEEPTYTDYRVELHKNAIMVFGE